MNAQRYLALLGWFRAHPVAKGVLYWVSKGAVVLVYAGYLLMLGTLAWRRDAAFWPALTVPAAAFLAGTALRAVIDRPRPYTALGFEPLFPKAVAGQSMPSRHCFSAAAIAVAAWWAAPPLCGILAVAAVVIAASRVLCGVHYPSDVVAGLAFGVAVALVGLALWGCL